MDPSLRRKLYLDQPSCLHLEGYRIRNKFSSVVLCGPCYFRDGFEAEYPTRLNTRTREGILGGPSLDPQLLNHIGVSVGLVPPEPGQSLREFRTQRSVRSQPSPKRFPFSSALWLLMGVQPPLATVLVQFCEGYNEVEIGMKMDLSLYNVSDRLGKAVRTGQKFLKV
jgi:hypothetical protein